MPRAVPTMLLRRPPGVALLITWSLVAAAVLVQICYPLMPEHLRTAVTITSVLVFGSASLADVARVHGARGTVSLLGVAGGGGLLAEAVGLRTGVPFGTYAYAGDLGPELLRVPAIVPLAWTMMAWPALVVGRVLAHRVGAGAPAVVAIGGWALASWDVFLDPQMVAAGHWTWAYPEPALPFVPGVPLTNYLGWLLVATTMISLLHVLLADREAEISAPAAVLYLWAYSSSALAHAAFFGLPGSAVAGAVLMGLVAIPFALVLESRRGP